MKRSLSCISPDGRSTLSFCYNINNFSPGNEERSFLVVQFLPLTSTVSSNSNNNDDVSQDDRQQQQRDEDLHGSAYTYTDNPDVPQRLVLASNTQKKKKENITDRRQSRKFKIQVPNSIVSLLEIDVPIGLVYCDSNSLQEEHIKLGSTSTVQVALYSQSTVWLLEIGCNNDGNLDILSIIEPFERYLLSLPPGFRIVRVRSAPRDALAPAGSLAMLTTEGSLVLYHPAAVAPARRSHDRSPTPTPLSGIGARITIPVSMAPFLADDEEEVVTDFCFGVHNHCASYVGTNPSLGELSVLFLCQNGNVYGAAPVVFDCSAIPTSVVQARIQWMKSNVEYIRGREEEESASSTKINDEEEALMRMYSASQHWMQEIFRSNENISSNGSTGMSSSTTPSYRVPYNAYSTAQLFRHGNISHSADWPLQIQGPLVERLVDDNNNNNTLHGDAVVIEPLPSSLGAAAADTFVIGRKPSPSSTSVEIQVDVCILASPVLPRFSFESIQDRDILDDYCMDGVVLDSVFFDFNCAINGVDRKNFFLDIVVDPVTPYMVHAASAYGVCSISFDSLPTYLNQLARGDKSENRPSSSTFAWSCLCIDSEIDITFDGVVVSEDAQFGHVLMAHLTNNHVESIDVTASKYLSQVSRFAETQQRKQNQAEKNLMMTARNATETLQSIPQLSTEVAPLIQKISKGLSSMGRLVGSTTKPCDADGTTVATLLECKTSLEENVVVPLKELYTATRSREKQLIVLHDKQKEQLAKLVSMANSLKEQMVALEKKVSEINKKDEALSQRAASVLEASRGLLPKITDSELEYFTQLKRWEKQSDVWEEQIKKLKASIANIPAGRGDSASPLFSIQLSHSLQQMCQDLLAGQQLLLQNNKARLSDLEAKAERLMEVKNLK